MVVGDKDILVITPNRTGDLGSQLNGVALGLVMGLITGRGVLMDWAFGTYPTRNIST